MRIIGGILAGGQGRRMPGIDKPFAELAGLPLISHVIARLAQQTETVIINANGAPERFRIFGLDVIPDQIDGFRGPLAGVHALIQQANIIGAGHVLVAPADTPFLPSDLLERLLMAADEQDTVRVASSHGRRHPVVALWPVSLASDLADYLITSEDLSMVAYLRRVAVAEADFTGSEGLDPFFNINAPEDLARAEMMISGSLREPD